MYKAMKRDGDYLGKAHFRRMQRLYDLSGDSWYDLRENTGEYLVGDPFLRL
jgi:hypothetical protein